MSDLGVSAAKAYLQTAQTLAKSQGETGAFDPAQGFGDLLTHAMSTVSKAGATAEGAITNAAMGRSDIVDVVTAVAAAEATLQTVVSVRDEVIRAYQDIMRMPI
ncbi:flagellar hook-basal body complex protein FliE [bacterium]|nr:flagellar hook-basal body complex protein FliE [bacterium]